MLPSILHRSRRSGRRSRGLATVTALYFLLIMAVTLFGMSTFASWHQVRAQTDLGYAAALDAAEAGLNYEFRRISSSTSLAHQPGTPGTGTVATGGAGAFSTYCIGKDGNTWVPPNPLYVVSTGSYKGIQRTVKASVKGFYPDGRFAIYTMEGTSVFNGSAINILGDIGTNGYFDFSGHPAVNGSVYFYGSGAGWYNGNDPGGYTEGFGSQPIQWPTIHDIAMQMFPQGGLSWIATHNDNASAGIIGNSITDNITLGPGNYYVTNIDLKAQKKITFNNTLGPVNLWVGPEGGTGVCNFRGGTSAVHMDVNPNVHIYVATQSGIDLAGNEEIDACVYAYNKDANGNGYGYVANNGNPLIKGQIIANHVDICGNVDVDYVPGLANMSSFGYYGFDNSWIEQNPRY